MAGRRRATPARRNINVSVAMLGEALRVYELPTGSTVQSALSAAGLASSAGEVRVDTEPATMGTVLKHGQVVTVVQKVQGG